MQEIDDDDEIFTEMMDNQSFEPSDGWTNGNNTTNPQASSSGSTPESEEFVDHGLSYYYDPASSMHQLVPPPPPPPPVQTDASAFEENESEFYDCQDDASHVDAPPPPPPPLTLAPPPLTKCDEIGILARVPPSGLLQQIQLGAASLRHIKASAMCLGGLLRAVQPILSRY